MKQELLKQAAAHLGPGVDVATHFTPRYDPWEQRLCLVPDADLFHAVREGRASVVTGEIATITGTGVTLRSGATLEADILVTATGLVMQALGGVLLFVDGTPVELGSTLAYKGVMFSGVPNLAAVFGYVNASWTLKADLVCAWVCRLLNARIAAARGRSRRPRSARTGSRRSSSTSRPATCSGRSRAGPSRAAAPRGA